MPIHYLRDDGARCIRMTASGHTSVDEWRAAVGRQIAEGCWSYGLLFDSTKGTNTYTPGDVDEAYTTVQRLIEQHGRRGPVAFVAADDAQYGMGRMYGILAERLSFDHEVFRDVGSAAQWLVQHMDRQ